MSRSSNKDRGLLERPVGSGRWWVRVWYMGREHRFGIFPDRTTARIFYQRVKAEQREERFDPERYHKRRRGVTVGQWIDAYLEGCTLRTRRDQERFGKLWKGLLGARVLDQVTTAELAGLQAKLEAAGTISHATINRRFSFLRRLYNLALRDGKALKNPVVGIRFFAEPLGRTRYLTEGEEQRLAEVMAPADFALVRFALHTGLRQAEQFGLRWENVDKERRVLTIPRSKSGETRHVPLNAAALAVLDGLQSWMLSPWVFPGRSPGQPRNATAFYHRIYETALQRAGITGVTWHTLRHTFASRLVMAGVDLRTVQELMGHKSHEMTLRYAHLSPGHLHQAVQSLDPAPDRGPGGQGVRKPPYSEHEP